MLNANYIRSLSGDRECLEALAWLSERAKRYPRGGFTPPLKPKARATEPTPIVGVSIRLGRGALRGGGQKVTRVDWYDGTTSHSADGDIEGIAASLKSRLLCAAYSGYMLLTTGYRRGALDSLLDCVGPSLLRLGYSLSPCLSGGAVSFIIIRKGRHRWNLVYLETASGASLDTSLALAKRAGSEFATRSTIAHGVYLAGAALSQWLLREFGVALMPTAGMTAMAAARVTLPSGFQKWRPDPLLMAMEREAGGYRGGLTYALRYSGPTWRIDVTRQYTFALSQPLPLRSTFGRLHGDLDKRPGIFMCRVRTGNLLPYPLGVWRGIERGFQTESVGRGEYVCTLHSSEFEGLRASGATIDPSYGYVHTATFDFSAHVDHLQRIMTTHGRDSPEAKLSKPLGNYVYGKTGQKATRKELLFSEKNPGKAWYPYWDDEGTAWPMIWEKTVERPTASQHVDIAGTITGYARSQTVKMWAYLSSYGIDTVRCHTDSLTTSSDPTSRISSDGETIGGWRLETQDDRSVIVGPNAYFDQDGAHIAGVSEPTLEMIDRMHDGQIVHVTQSMKTPRQGFSRGAAQATRSLRSTAS